MRLGPPSVWACMHGATHLHLPPGSQRTHPPTQALLPVLCTCRPTTAPAPFTRMPGKVTGVLRPDHSSQKKTVSQLPRSPSADSREPIEHPCRCSSTSGHQNMQTDERHTLPPPFPQKKVGSRRCRTGECATITWQNLPGSESRRQSSKPINDP